MARGRKASGRETTQCRLSAEVCDLLAALAVAGGTTGVEVGDRLLLRVLEYEFAKLSPVARKAARRGAAERKREMQRRAMGDVRPAKRT